MADALGARAGGALIHCLIGVFALIVPAIGFVGLFRTALAAHTATYERMAQFWNALPGSVLGAVVVGIVVAVVVAVLSPAANGEGASSRSRLVLLAVGACVPQIVLVLGAILVLPLLGRDVVSWTFHVLAVLPIASVIGALALEALLRRAAAETSRLGLPPSRRRTVVARILSQRLLLLVTFAAAAAFQNYLINLCLRQSPASDALVALSALSPHTGLDWTLVLTACGSIWVLYLAAAVSLNALLRMHAWGRAQ